MNQRLPSGVTVLILLFAFATLSSSQEVRHTLQDGQSPCPGEEIVFTCVTRGSPIIAWTSNEYIEQGGTQLEFATFNNEGYERTSPINSNTVATLTRKAMEDGEQVLESQLRITTLRRFPSFSVTCIHIGSGKRNETSLQLLLGDPSEPQNSKSDQEYANVGGCAVLVSWANPDNTAFVDITRYMVHINDSNILNATSISKNSSYSVHVVHCAVHNVTIRAVNRCGQLGLSSPIIKAYLPRPAVTDSQEGTTPPPHPIVICTYCPSWIIAICVILPLLLCILLYLIVLLIRHLKSQKIRRYLQENVKYIPGRTEQKPRENPMYCGGYDAGLDYEISLHDNVTSPASAYEEMNCEAGNDVDPSQDPQGVRLPVDGEPEDCSGEQPE